MLRIVIVAGLALAGCVGQELDVDVEVAEIQSEDNANAELRGASATGVCKMDVVLPPDEDGDSQDPIVCSCLVVAPDLVLTSARCVNENVDANMIDQITIGFGADGNNQPTTATAVELHRYFDKDNPNLFQLAFVHLASPAPETPVTLNAADISDLASTNVDLVGFGETANDVGDFLRRSVELPVSLVERDTIRVGDDANRNCAGDSGGGVFHDFGDGETLIAVSRRQGSCSETVSMTRVDRHVNDFLFPYIDQVSGPCAADDVCTMDCPRTPDPDCGDLCQWGNDCAEDMGEECTTRDWDCGLGSFPGEACAKSGDCEQGGACIAAADDATFLYCDKPCEVDEDCPAMMTCNDSGRCEYGTPSPGSQGFPCTMNEQCRSGICEDLICVRECDPAASDCPSEFTCGPSKVSEGAFVCLGEDLSGGGGFCQAGSSGAAGGTGLLLLLALLWIRRRPAAR